jgi:hypothetical protein
MAGDEMEARIERRPPEGKHIGVCIAQAVAEANAVETRELEAELNEVVDPDALNRLFSDRPNGAPRDGGTVSFEIADCRVTVDPDRTVVVEPTARA